MIRSGHIASSCVNKYESLFSNKKSVAYSNWMFQQKMFHHHCITHRRFEEKSKRILKVRSFPVATMKDMQSYTISLMSKQPNSIILHVSTNDAIIHGLNIVRGGSPKFEGFCSGKVTEWKNYLIVFDIAYQFR